MPISEPTQMLGDFTDSFAGPGLDPYWKWQHGGPGAATVAGGTLTLSPGETYGYSRVRSQDTGASMVERDMVVEVVAFQLGHDDAYWQVAVDDEEGSGKSLTFHLANQPHSFLPHPGGVGPFLQVRPEWLSTSAIVQMSYNPAAHRWLRIALRGATVYALASPDGTAWTVLASFAATSGGSSFAIASGEPFLRMTSGDALGSYLRLANYNLPIIPFWSSCRLPNPLTWTTTP